MSLFYEALLCSSNVRKNSEVTQTTQTTKKTKQASLFVSRILFYEDDYPKDKQNRECSLQTHFSSSENLGPF